MSKKSRLQVSWIPKIEASGERRIAIHFHGQNSKGTDCEVKVEIDKWDAVEVIRKIKKVSIEWQCQAIELNNQITEAAK